MSAVLQARDLGKRYRLGVISRGMLYKDVQSWWARLRGHEDPNSQVTRQPGAAASTGESFWAFRNVSFSVGQGEIVGIIGRNGAGKSTLLKVISQITAPSEGEFRLRGKLASLLEVGTGFHGELTGRENIYLNGAILGMSRAEVSAEFERIVEFAEVGQFIDTPVKRYSSGMYVRLAFSVAAHLQPDILIVDEVLAVGDAAFQKKCLGRMDEAAFQEGRTILFVSHNMASVRELCTRVIMMKAGRIEADGAAGETIDRYLDQSTLEWDSGSRAGSGRLRVTGVQLLDRNGGRAAELRVGEACRVRIGFENHGLTDTDEVTVGLSLHSASTDLFCNYSHFSGKTFARLRDRGEFEFEWPSVDVVPGHYTLGVRVFANGDQHTGERLDTPPPVILPVVPSDFHGMGEKENLNYGVILVRGKWSAHAA